MCVCVLKGGGGRVLFIVKTHQDRMTWARVEKTPQEKKSFRYALITADDDSVYSHHLHAFLKKY